MIKTEISKLLARTDIDIPRELIGRELSLTDKPDEANGDSLLFITKTAFGKDREPTFPKGAKIGAIISEERELPYAEGIPHLFTENARAALAIAYCNYYRIDESKTVFIGITGTNGKTSTATMLEKMLLYSGKRVGFIGTGRVRIDGKIISDGFYSMTTPEPKELYALISRMQDEGCEYVIIEVSAQALSQKRTEAIPFKLGIFTNLSEEHRDYYNNMEEYYQSKLSLFNKCELGVFNLDDAYSLRAYEEAECKKYGAGIINQGDAYLTEVTLDGVYGSNYFYRERGLIFKVRLKLGGHGNVYNSLLALKAGILLGLPPCKLKRGLEEIEVIDGRMERLQGDVTVIIDYAHTPLAFENLLKTTKASLNAKQNLIVLFGCGGERDKKKRAEMGRIASQYANKIIITEDNSRSENPDEIFKDISKGIARDSDFETIKNRAEAISYAIISARSEDIILLVGKGAEEYIIDNRGYSSYSERSVAISALEKRRASILANKA